MKGFIMEITLNVKSDQVSDSLSEIMTHLTDDQKESIAKQMLNKWLEEPCVLDKVQRESEALRQLKSSPNREIYLSNYGRIYVEKATDEQLKQSSEYREFLRNYKTPKELMLEGITAKVIAYHQQEVSKAIESDPRTNAIKEATIEHLKQNYGALVQNSIMYWLSNHMSEIAMGVQQSLCKLPSIEDNVRAINERLLSRS
jgi:hypothetical protein